MALKFLTKESLCAYIENSIGSKQFRSAYFKDSETGDVSDIYRDGEVSCAFYVSSLLVLSHLLDAPKATVKSLESYLSSSDAWEVVRSGEKGDIVIWEAQQHDSGEEHMHIGFILDDEMAVSSDDRDKCIKKHDITYRDRVVSTYYRLKN